jgi:glucose-6-phosphate isomerase
MPEIIGGRYSVFTSVGLIPLALMGYDIQKLLLGVKEATNSENEIKTAEDATLLFSYMKQSYRSLNFLLFDDRLLNFGYWHRQLTAESLGKEFDNDGNPVDIGFLPTVSTVVDLHSVGQLYFSGFKGIYTDFITIDTETTNYNVPDETFFSDSFNGKSIFEIRSAISAGVLGAYKERKLPYRLTTLQNDSLEYSLGLLMGSRMLETMYIANLMGVNSFNQPNVELYKQITHSILES